MSGSVSSPRKQVIVQGKVATYKEWGDQDSKQTVIALHGWADSAETFRLLASALSGPCRVVAPDLPGFGGSEMTKEVMDLSAYAEWVRDFAHKLDLGKKLTIIGHSNGGAIAVKLISLNYLPVDRLVLIASAGVRSEQRVQKKIMSTAAKPAKLGLKLLPESRAHSLKKKAYKAIGSDYMVAEGMQETFKKVVGEDVLAASQSVTTPTFLVYGDKDEDTPVRYGEAFQENLANAQLKVVGDAGHFVHHNHCEEVAQAVMEFMEL